MTTSTAPFEARQLSDEDKGSISACFVVEALEGFRAHGPAVLDALLLEADIAPELLHAPRARISPERFGALWRLLAERFDDEFFGMDAHRMKAGSFVTLCHAVLHCATLEQALRHALRFMRLVLDDIDGRLERDDAGAHLVLAERHAEPRAFAAGTLLVILHGLACWLIGRRVPLTTAAFRSAAPPFVDELRVIFCPELRFGQTASSITFDRRYLSLPVVQSERSLKAFLRDAPANFLVKYRNSEGAAASVRGHLKRLPVADWPGFEMLARQMHSSASTLRRRLDAEGQSYRAICDELRHDLALDYLCRTTMTIPQIAQALGFAESSAFHRAFRKWSGASPGAYRRNQQSSAARSDAVPLQAR